MRYRERTSLIEDLISAPWWVSLIVLVFGNIVIRFIIPEWFSGEERTPGQIGVLLSGGIANTMPMIANMFSMVAGFTLILSGGREIIKRLKN